MSRIYLVYIIWVMLCIFGSIIIKLLSAYGWWLIWCGVALAAIPAVLFWLRVLLMYIIMGGNTN
jgi:hypothetical protein